MQWTRFLLSSFVLLCAACTIQIGGSFGPSEEGGSFGAGSFTPLPDPTVWRMPPPVLTSEQQKRQNEVSQYLAEQYQSYSIVETIQSYSGGIVDWVEPNSIPGAIFEAPALPFDLEAFTLPPGVEFARTELELYPELRGPAGTTPFHRPELWGYVMGETGATSVEDYLSNHQIAGQPDGLYRLYSGIRYPAVNRAVSGGINQFYGDIEPETFSLIEVAVACDGLEKTTTLEQVGAVVSRDHANFRTMDTRIHVEFFTQGERFGPNIGGWDHRKAGFVAFPSRPYGPNEVVPTSTPGLGNQQEHYFHIGQDAAGNWWIAHNKNLLGYYPAGLFDILNMGACSAAWYGEVYDPTPTDWTWTDMGSGQFSDAGYGYASYVRDPMYYDILNNPWYPADTSETFNATNMISYEPKCYNRSLLTKAVAPWGRYLYLGGPGGDAPGCD